MFLIPCIIEIKNRREKLKLSKQRLALQAGLPSNAVYRIESGETKKIFAACQSAALKKES